MADRLEKHLVKIEQGLGGDGSLPKNYNQVDKLDWHLTKIEDLIEEGGGGGGGTTVIANPEMSGDEDDLVGLQVGTTKYKVSGEGGNTTKHNLVIRTWDDGDGHISQEFDIDGQGYESGYVVEDDTAWTNLFNEISSGSTYDANAFIATPLFNEGTIFSNVLLTAYENINENEETIQGISLEVITSFDYCGYININYNTNRKRIYIDFTEWYEKPQFRQLWLSNETHDIVYDSILLPSWMSYCPFNFDEGDVDWIYGCQDINEWNERFVSDRIADLSRDPVFGLEIRIMLVDDNELPVNNYTGVLWYIYDEDNDIFNVHISTCNGDFVFEIGEMNEGE